MKGSMGKPDESESLPWGTLEELLLACAIHRHGTDSWESVAREIQKRISTVSQSFTSHNCKKKYLDLKRRFDSHPDLAGGDTPIPWLDQLRSRRIAELKRDLQRYDLSIGSLELKLKRLSEDRENCLTENDTGVPDLQGYDQEETPLDACAAKAESGEDSYNGSSESIAVAKTEPICDSAALVELVAGSKRGEENQCAAGECTSVNPQPLADLLDVIRHHKFSSLFQRRLHSQESSRYKKTIRQHTDLATIRERLEEGLYSECQSSFYRDLLVVATNATLFFPKTSIEHKSAIELRQLVSSKLPRHHSKVKLEYDFPVSLPLLTSPVNACGKRSSIVLNKKSNNVETSGSGMKKSVTEFLNRIQKDESDTSCKGSSPVNAKEKGKKNEGSKTEMGRPPKRAAAVAGTKRRRSHGGRHKPADQALLPKKRTRN